MSGGGATPLTCDNMTGADHCGREVGYLDTAGFVYCEPCGLTRRQYEPCRKLRPWELRKLERGEALARY